MRGSTVAMIQCCLLLLASRASWGVRVQQTARSHRWASQHVSATSLLLWFDNPWSGHCQKCSAVSFLHVSRLSTTACST